MLFGSPPLLRDIEPTNQMPSKPAATPSRRVKLDLPCLLACLMAWRGNHDPAAGWALITAARHARGKEKQAVLCLLKQMLEFDTTADSADPQQVASASFEIETQTWKPNRAEMVASGDLG